MPSTESRSRDEWLAEVQRRGGRIRRRRLLRRRLAVALVGVFAAVLSVSPVATLLGGEPDRTVERTAGGPAPAAHRELPADPVPAGPASGAGVVEPTAPADAPAAAAAPTEERMPAGGVSPSTTAEVHRRVAAIDGSPAPPSPTSVPPADDPVVRPPPTTVASSGTTSAVVAGRSNAASSTAVQSTDDRSVAACPASEVSVTVVTDKATYAPGETVTGTSTLENRSAATCLVPTRAFFRIEDATGRVVGSFASTAEYRMPVKAEPGKAFTSGFSWDQKDCSGSTCDQVPAGSYAAVADWTEGGPYAGRGSFDIGA